MAKEKKEGAAVSGSQQQPDHVTLVGSRSGRELKLEKTTDKKGVVYYEADLDWRKSD